MPMVLSPPRAISADPPRRSHNSGAICFAPGARPSTSDTPTYSGRMGVTSSRKREFAPWSLKGEAKGDIADPRFRRIHGVVKSVGTLDESLWGDDSPNYGTEDLHYAYVGPFDGTKK